MSDVGKTTGITSTERGITERKREEENLRRMATVVRDSNDAITIQDSEGRITAWNRGAELMYGYGEKEALQMNMGRLTAPGKVEEQKDFARRLMAGEEITSFETQRVTKDGRFLDVWMTVTKLMDDAGKTIGIASTERDITERKLAEEELREANDYLENLINHANAPIIVWDPQFRITRFNDAFESLTGRRADEVIGKSIEILFPPASVESSMGLIAKTQSGERWETVEICIQHVDETVRTVLWNSATLFATDGKTPVATIAQGLDITERKRAEEALRRERDLVAKIIETSPIGIMARDSQGEITFANAEAERILGLTRDGARHGYNAPDWPITDYEGRPFPVEKLPSRQVKATGRPVYDVRYAIENASGERVYLSVNAAPALGENGEWDGVIASIDDVSKLTRADATRELLEAELLQSQKMEAVGKLATGVAHNFNNLLTAITGYGELLLARLPADSDLRPDVEEIGRAGERAAEVARGLLRFSRRGREYRERLDLNIVIREMEALLRQVIRSNIEITTVLSNGLDRIRNNQSLIEQVIVNLIVNASDAMPDGGKLTIETANLHLAEPRLVRDLSLPAGSYVTLAVRDSGIGINEEMQARLFEPFYTTKGPDSGTGLGLSTVCGIVEESEGAILVESAPGQGSTFTIFLPSIPDQRSRP